MSIKNKIFIFLLSFYFFQSSLSISDEWLGVKNEAGFLGTEYNQVFYWLFRSSSSHSQNSLIIWLSGFACQTTLQIFNGNGPFRISKDQKLKLNPFSWNILSDIVYLEQSNDPWTNLYYFFQKFPEFNGRKIYLAGDAMAGHYLPSHATYINSMKNENIRISGVLLENSWIYPSLQYSTNADYAYDNKMIGLIKYGSSKMSYKACSSLIDAMNWPVAAITCEGISTSILGILNYYNKYDIRQQCNSFTGCNNNFSNIDNFLKNDYIVNYLGVKDNNYWKNCKVEISEPLKPDLGDMSKYIKELLDDNIAVYSYYGDKDFFCNWKGGEMWINNIEWKKQNEFKNSKYNDFNIRGKKIGEFKEIEKLGFFKIFECGHL